MKGALVSIHDPAPCRLVARTNREPRRAFASSVTLVRELSHRLLALVAAPTPEISNEMAERVAWGLWQAGMHFDRTPLLPWDGVPYDPPKLYPHPEPGSTVWSRPTVEPQSWIYVFGGGDKGPSYLTAIKLAAACDYGMVSGPARWDHRSQYTSARRAPVGDGWTVGDVVDELDAETGSKRKRVRPALRPAAVFAAIAAVDVV